ncbi:hypothetical protein BC828DRAFT_417009 [Blastocladiella britannica]|nr:hypothetical protein BC828DRAFT_417009 [Blastocladiella britannica]
MKFGRTIELETAALPPEMRDQVLSYKQLKKMLKHIVRDLEARGLSPVLLQQLLNPPVSVVSGATQEALPPPPPCITSRELADALERAARIRAAACALDVDEEGGATTTTDDDDEDDADNGVCIRPRHRNRRISVASTASSVASSIFTTSTAAYSPPTAPASAAAVALVDEGLGLSVASEMVADTHLHLEQDDEEHEVDSWPRRRRGSLVSIATISTVVLPAPSRPPSLFVSPAQPIASYVIEEQQQAKGKVVSSDSDGDVDDEAVDTVALSDAPDSPSSPRSNKSFGSQLVIKLDDSTRELVEPVLACRDCRVDPGHGTFTIPLPTDSDFFSQLTTALDRVSEFQDHQIADHFHSELAQLVRSIGDLTSTECRDYRTWRAVVRAYLEADLFMSVTRRAKPVADVAVNLARFQAAVAMALEQPGFDLDNLSIHSVATPTAASAPGTSMVRAPPPPPQKKTGLFSSLRHFLHLPGTRGGLGPNRFRDARSWAVYQQFMHLNAELLGLSRLVSLNDTAVRKILKKHDKKTRLPSLDAWRQLDVGRQVADARGAKFTLALVAELQGTLEKVTPLVDSYACPVCMAIMYPPIKLPNCAHSLCYPCAYRLALQANKPMHSHQLPEGVPEHALRLSPRVFLQRYPHAALRQPSQAPAPQSQPATGGRRSSLPMLPPPPPLATMHCPLCRADTGAHFQNAAQVLLQHEDVPLGNTLARSFPVEVKIKKREFADRCAAEDAEWAGIMMTRIL